MNLNGRLMLLAGFVLAAVVVGCSGDSGKQELNVAVSLGEDTINLLEAQTSDRFPPGCDKAKTPSCTIASDQAKYVILWFSTSSTTGFGVAVEEMGRVAVFADKSGDAWLMDSAGTRTHISANGMEQGRFFAIFEVDVTSKGFKLFWPGETGEAQEIDLKF